MTTSIAEQLDANAHADPDAIWITSPNTSATVTWAEAASRSRRIACQLDALGLEPGTSVAVAAPNSIWATLCFTGVACGGYLATPLNLVAGARVLPYVLDHSEAAVVLCADECRPLIEDALMAVERPITIIRIDPTNGPVWAQDCDPQATIRTNPLPDTPGVLMYTSGTTGRPKGVVLSNSNLMAAGMNVVHSHQLQPSDIAMCILPIYHINGLCTTIMGTLMSRSGLVMPDRFSVRTFWQFIGDNDVSWFSAVPTHYAYLLSETTEPEINRSRLRFARSASAPLAPDTHRQFEDRFGIKIIETMGLTETGGQILSNPMPPGVVKIGSTGRAVGNEVIIGDDNQTEVGRGSTGEILVRGANVMRGYLKQPEETAKSITPEGWFRTGDLGHMDDDGFVFVTGRIKELIIKGGENIAPREVDEVLLEHEAVLEAAAFAVPCDQLGQRVESCVAFQPGRSATEAELLAHSAAQLGQFKAPDRVHFLDELPKGPSGKIQRLQLYSLVYGADS